MPRASQPAPTAAPAPTTAPSTGAGDRRMPAGERPMARPAGAGQQTVSLALPTGDPSTGILLIEKTGPTQVIAGAPFEYTITATNLTSDLELRNVVVRDILPGNVTVSSAADARVSGNSLEWSVGTLAPGASDSIVVTGTAAGTGTVVICATAEYDVFLCLTFETVQPQLVLTKEAPREVLSCDPIEYVLIVENTGSGTASNVRITDRLPSGLTTDGSTTFDLGDIAPGQSERVTLTAMASNKGSYTNSATVTADGGLSATAETTTIVRKPDLEVTKTAPGRAFIDSRFNYRITVRNTGDAPAADTVLRDTLPAGMTADSASDGGQISGSTVTWNLGTLNPGDSRDVTITVQGANAGMYTNTAEVTAYCAEATDRTRSSADTELFGKEAILLEVVDTDYDPVLVGQEGRYIITVTNQGSKTDTNIRIVATLDGMDFLRAEGPSGQPSVSGRTITFPPLAELAPGNKVVYTVFGEAVETGGRRFRIELTSAATGSNPVIETESTHIYDESSFGDSK
ncbi:MAG: hypothetical protein RLY93_18965 [Sumerlaeia bacterium]